MKASVLKIGDLARQSGLSVRTLRGYENLGIITPSRSDGGTRFYTEADVLIAQVVQRMRELDIPVELIQTIATKRHEYSTGDQSSTIMIEILEDLNDALSERMAKTIDLQDELNKTLRLVRGCQGCKNKPNPENCPTCPMEVSSNKTGMSRLIW